MDINNANELDEKDFIRNGGDQPPLPSWMLALILMGVISLLWLGGAWVMRELDANPDERPFLQVTNRELSLFLWENPDYMRGVFSEKTGYLPGFSSLKRVARPEKSNELVSTPPRVLFRYHTWKRLVSEYNFPRPISLTEFEDFILSDDQWRPEFWPDAPQGYVNLIKDLGSSAPQDLQTLPLTTLPKVVRDAFRGWENHFREGESINALLPKYGEMEFFLRKYPHYSRNYWRNIFPNYLKSMSTPDYDPDKLVPNEEFPAFLRVAYFNSLQ